MINSTGKLKLFSLLVLASLATTLSFAQSRLAYVGNNGGERFYKMFRLSNGTVLVAGRVNNLNWVPAAVPRQTLLVPNTDKLATGAINARDTNNLGVLLHMSRNLDTLLSVVQFPSGSVTDITRIRATNQPGQPTGNIYISGRRNSPFSGQTGFYIARLNNNFVNGVPTGCVWFRNIGSKPRSTNQFSGPFPNTGQDSDHKIFQPWDVGADGKVVLAAGTEFESDFAQINRFDANGNLDTCYGWTTHYARVKYRWNGRDTTGNTELRFVGRSNLPDSVRFRISPTGVTPEVFDTVKVDSITHSAVIMKVNRNGSNLRSYTTADWNFVTTDENGNPGRRHANPDDYFYDTLCIGCTVGTQGGNFPNNAGPGYTGYSFFNPNNNVATQRVGGIVIDRRNNNLYYGYASYSTYRTNSPHDFEPALVAMNPQGNVRWWARLYKEDTASEAGQLIDGLELDYNADEVVVLGRSIGKSTKNNLWEGDQIAANPGGKGFMNRFTGNNIADITAQWLGRYNMNQLQIKRSTYIGEPTGNTPQLVADSRVNMDGFSDPNQLNANLANTRVYDMQVLPNGNVAIAGFTDGRAITTANAFMKSPKPDRNGVIDSLSAASAFVRIYSKDLDSLVYSSLVTNVSNPRNGADGGTVDVQGILPTEDGNGLYVAGYQGATSTLPRNIAGGRIPTVNPPSWATHNTGIESGILGLLRFSCTGSRPAKPSGVSGPVLQCANSSQTFRLTTPVANAINYAWALPGSNWTGESVADTIRISATQGSGGVLRVVAVNECGVSEPFLFDLSTPTTTPRPTNATIPAAHCEGTNRWYKATGVPAGSVSQFRWSFPAGYQPTSGVNDTITTADSIQVTALTGTFTAGIIRVAAFGTCGRSQNYSRSLPIPAKLPDVPTFSVSGTTLTSSAVNGNQWLLNGSPITGATTRTLNITGLNGIVTIQVSNACGAVVSTQNLSVSIAGDVLATQTKVYPNPAKDRVNVAIENDYNGSVNFRITDLSGRTIYQSTELKEEALLSKTIATGGLKSGLYLLEITTDKHRAISRIEIQ